MWMVSLRRSGEKASCEMALVIITLHPPVESCAWLSSEYRYQSTTAQPRQRRKQYYHHLWDLPSINHHAVIRTPLCIPLQPWKSWPKSVLNSKQNYLPRLGRRVCPDSLPRIIPCSTHLRAWIIQRTSLLTNLSYSPAAFCYSVLYSIHCEIVTRPDVHQI